MSDIDNKKDVRLTVYVTSKMDEMITASANAVGVPKHEFVRSCIAEHFRNQILATGVVQNVSAELKDI